MHHQEILVFHYHDPGFEYFYKNCELWLLNINFHLMASLLSKKILKLIDSLDNFFFLRNLIMVFLK